MIKEFKKLSLVKKISFLFILTLLITLPVVALIAQQPKDLNSKASEPEPTPTPTKVVTRNISPKPSKKFQPTIEIYLDDDVRIIQNGQIPHPTSTPTPTPTVTPTPVSTIWIP